MRMPIRTVVAAAAAGSTRRQLIRMLSLSGRMLEAMPGCGCDVRRELMACRPDLLILDAQLPGISGMALARAVLEDGAILKRPRLILLQERGACAHGEELARLGAAFLEKPLVQADFDAALASLEAAPPAFSKGRLACIEGVLDELGMPAHPGRECLKYAALLAASDAGMVGRLRSVLYAQVGEICGMQPRQAERAMRHAINAAWRSDKFENQYRIFADTVDAGRGEPTLSEMIARLADILRLEG